MTQHLRVLLVSLGLLGSPVGLLGSPAALPGSTVVLDLLSGLDMFGTLQSPNFPDPYPDRTWIRWNITAPPGFSVHLFFSHFQLEPSYGCQYDYVRVEAQHEVLAVFCGEESTDTEEVPDQRIVSGPGNFLSLVFSSDFSNEQRYTGFRAHYSATDVDECGGSTHSCDHYCHNYIGGFYCSCRHGYLLHTDNRTCTVQCSGSVYTEHSGVLSSVDFPSPYPKNSDCTYSIAVDEGFQLTLQFDDDFDVEDHPDVSCPYDYIQVSTSGSAFGPFCGRLSPGVVHTESNSATIIFHSDQSGENRGWRLHYTVTGSQCPLPVAPPHVVMDSSQSEFLFKDHLLLTCEPGYRLLQDGQVLSHYQMVCGSNGSWTDRLPHCQLVDCGTPPEATGAEVLFGNHDNRTTLGSRVQYLCRDDDGTLTGNHSFSCSLTGDWTDSEGRSQLPRCQTACGRPSRALPRQVKRIIGGRRSDLGLFPWQVLLSVEDQSRVPEGRWFGSGALLSPSWVLTAAHVLRSPRRDGGVVAVVPEHITVFLGLLDVRLKDSAQRRSASRVLLHPTFDPGTFQHDIALLRLDRVALLSRDVAPVCLPPQHRQGYPPDPPLASLGVVAGWGISNVSRNQDQDHEMTLSRDQIQHQIQDKDRAQHQVQDPVLPSEVLQYVRLPVVHQDLCSSSYARFSTRYIVTDQMFCAGFPDGGHDACLGDSGGAFVVQDRGRWTVSGLVSWGGPVDCGSRGVYGVYTRVSSYVDWIQDHMDADRR